MPPKGNSKRGGAAAGRRKEPAVLPVAQKRPRETTTTSSVTANPHREVLALQNANPILSFWWRCANTRSFLPLALYALDVDWQGIYRLRDGHVAPKSKEDGDKKGQATVHEQVMVAYRLVTDQRLHTAYDCLLLARRLLCDKENFVAKTADGGKSKKGTRKGDKENRASLTQLYNSYVECAEAALPSRSGVTPFLVRETDPEFSSTHYLPLRLKRLLNRICAIQRLSEIRLHYSTVMTVIGRCRGEAELLSFLFAANPTRDRMTPLLGSTSQHHLERAVLTKLLASVNDDCKVDAAAWGPLAVLPRLQVREGLYVLQDSARRETMRALLKECDLYGLPPFLRSIRNPNREEESAHHELQDKSSSYLNDHRSHFFLSVDALDSAHFLVGQAEPLILQTVGEELIELSGKHMAYGLLIGEPDQIVGLLKQHNEWTAAKTARQWKEEHAEEVVKVEIAEEEEGAASGPAERRKPNPLLPHVRRTLLAAQKQQTEQLELEMQGNPSSEATSNASDKLFTQVHWITPNRLVDRPAYSYYGLIYAVVIESDVQLHDAGKLPELSVDADQVATEHNDRDVSFYVSTVVELKRN